MSRKVPSKNRTLSCGRPLPEKRPSEISVKSWQEKLSQYLDLRELNQSESRNNLIPLLLAETGHFTVPDFIKKVHQTYPEIGAATVYRNIPLLLDVGILKETLTDHNGQKVYEISDDLHHDHIVCLDCNEIFEFHEESIETAQEKICRQMKFKPIKHRHVIYSHCSFFEHK